MRKLAMIAVSVLSLSGPVSLATVAFAQDAMVSGEVKKVDAKAGKITLKHGPIANLDMDSMTMVFRVQEPAMLENLQPGDQVKFTADRVNGAITVTSIIK